MDKQLSTPTKILLLGGAGLLAVIVGPILYLFPRDTGAWFAWTIQHPLTPVFMGASYIAGIANIWSVMINRWGVSRLLFPGIIVFALTMLVATLLHIPIFNWSNPIAWGWLIVYITSPLASIALLIINDRGYKSPQSYVPDLPPGFRPIMMAIAIIQLLIGMSLFLLATQVVNLWAWSLTPLTARVIGGWYLSGGVLLLVLSQQQTFQNVRVGLLANLIVSSLTLLGATLHRNEFDGPTASIVFYLLNALLIGVFSAYAWIRATRRSDLKAAANP